MTTIESCSKLYEWFAKNDTFSLKNLKDIAHVSDNPSADEASILSALSEFDKLGLVICQKVKDENYWVLKRPFSSMEQTVNISANTALSLANFINEICDYNKSTENYANPLEIRERDIQFLLYLLNEKEEEK
jgi:hypothetical protein